MDRTDKQHLKTHTETCNIKLKQKTIKFKKKSKPIKLKKKSKYYLNKSISLLKRNKYRLRSYQKEGVEWMIKREMSKNIKGGFLCDEMGLGKTIQCISLIIGHNVSGKTLIVTPSTVLVQWAREIQKFAPHLNVIIHHNRFKLKSLDEQQFINADVILTTYGLCLTPKTKTDTILHRYKWGRIILDECHLIRNPRSNRFKGCISLKSDIKWGLTGTPIQNYMRDFYTMFSFLGLNKMDIKNNIDKIRDKYIKRRTKHSLEKDLDAFKLPELVIENVEVPFKSNDEEEFYSSVKENLLKSYYEFGEFESNAHALAILTRLRQASIHPQLVIDALNKKNKEQIPDWNSVPTKMSYIVNKIKEEKEKTIVFCHFSKEVDILQLLLEKEGFHIDKITGKTSPHDRVLILENADNIDVLLVNICAGGVGMNMTMFSRVFITMPSWNPCSDAQAIARSHRIGQNKPVRVTYVILSSDNIKTIDEGILAIQMKKKIMISNVLNDEHCFSKVKNMKLSTADYRRLFR